MIVQTQLLLLLLLDRQGATGQICTPPKWRNKSFGSKKFHAEPTGNDVPIKCQIKNETDSTMPSDANPVFWFWHDLRHLGSAPDTSPPAIENISTYHQLSDLPDGGNWTYFTGQLGTQIYPIPPGKTTVDSNTRLKYSYSWSGAPGIVNQTIFKKSGQRLMILRVAPSKTDGYFTCVYKKPCGSLIAHSMRVEARNRFVVKPAIINKGSSCCVNDITESSCTRQVEVASNFTIRCIVASDTNTNIKWAIFNQTSSTWNITGKLSGSEQIMGQQARLPSNDTCLRNYKSDYESILHIDRVDLETNGTRYKCIATNTQGSAEYIWQVDVAASVIANAEVWIAIVAALAIILSIVIIVAVKLGHYRSKSRGLKNYEFPDLPMQSYHTVDNREETPFLPGYESEIVAMIHGFPPNVQLDRSSISLFETIGTGQFGVVYRAEMDMGNGLVKQVAIKTLKNEMNLEDNNKNTKDLINEFKTMWGYGRHENLIGLVGICATHKPYWLVMEYCAKGALRDLLQSKRPSSGTIQTHCQEGTESDYDRQLSLVDLISMVRQIAVGMRYLEEKCCIHRDLATRNILVTQNLACKISDFGLARNVDETNYIYTMASQPAPAAKFLPWRWMSIETLEQNIFTTASDVWSFGVVMWEIFAFGMTPYMTLENEEILKFLQKAKRLDRPKHATPELYRIMQDCWHVSPSSRPTFRSISEDAEKMLYNLGVAEDYLTFGDDE